MGRFGSGDPAQKSPPPQAQHKQQVEGWPQAESKEQSTRKGWQVQSVAAYRQEISAVAEGFNRLWKGEAV